MTGHRHDDELVVVVVNQPSEAPVRRASESPLGLLQALVLLIEHGDDVILALQRADQCRVNVPAAAPEARNSYPDFLGSGGHGHPSFPVT